MDTDPPNNDAASFLYDLFHLGLAWLREDRPDTLDRRGASVFASLGFAIPLLKDARQLAPESWDLMELVRDHSLICEGSKAPTKRELRSKISDVEQLNIILAVPVAEMSPERFFGPKGYSHVITDAGIAYALSRAPLYEGVVTKEAFLQGWRTHKTQMANYSAKNAAPKQESIDEEAAREQGADWGIIPEAPREENFDW